MTGISNSAPRLRVVARRGAPVTPEQTAQDRSWMSAALTGDRDAFEQLYRRYAPVSLALARRILGAAGPAEDVVQLVFLDLWRQGARYDPARATVAAWLLTLTHHKAVDAVRHDDRHRRRRTSVDALDTTADDVAGPEQLTVDADRRAMVRSALARLNGAQRVTLELAYFSGKTFREIAELTKVPKGTAKSRGRSGLRRLHDLLAAA